MSENLPNNVLVVGIGNTTMMDEGLGVYTLRELEKKSLPGDVTLFDAGTDVFKMMSCDKEFHTVIIVDAIRKEAVPGTIHQLLLDEIQIVPPQNHLHQISFIEAIKLMKYSCNNIRNATVILMGIEPKKIEFGIGLSVEVLKSMVTLVELIQKEIYNARSIFSEKYT